ncbi:LacI family DNA-binding transcriptional regulator [Rhizobium sp. L80/93]|uniref:LacI family DNA-binding transcriptional regulator n=2 Tax=unclassified Rhizobium TaxID=2613769 RepID=UPI001FFDFD04|nr:MULTISPECIES: LacI family DNA-binding transcriptional regulator [unclassified Rhizobium]
MQDSVGMEPGTRRNKRTRVRLRDVAQKVGVSPITVSRVLRAPDKVSAELRENILRVIDDMGYVPDLAARALAGRHSGIIAVLAPAINSQILSDVMSGIEARVRNTGLHTQYANTVYSGGEETGQIRNLLTQNPAGILLVGTECCERIAPTVISATCPVSYIIDHSQKPEEPMAAAIDHEAVGEAATRHLVSAGYRRIGLLGGYLDVRSNRRRQGYENVLQAAGIHDPDLMLMEDEPTSVALGCRLFSELLARAPDVDAVLCQNDDLALGVLFECQRRGISVPGDLGICGINNLEFAASSHPAITTVDIPRFELGFEAADLLIQAIGGGEVASRRKLGFKLLVRGTTR